MNCFTYISVSSQHPKDFHPESGPQFSMGFIIFLQEIISPCLTTHQKMHSVKCLLRGTTNRKIQTYTEMCVRRQWNYFYVGKRETNEASPHSSVI